MAKRAARIDGKNRKLKIRLRRRDRLFVTRFLEKGPGDLQVFRRAQFLHLLHEGRSARYVAELFRMSAKGVRAIGCATVTQVSMRRCTATSTLAEFRKLTMISASRLLRWLLGRHQEAQRVGVSAKPQQKRLSAASCLRSAVRPFAESSRLQHEFRISFAFFRSVSDGGLLVEDRRYVTCGTPATLRSLRQSASLSCARPIAIARSGWTQRRSARRSL